LGRVARHRARRARRGSPGRGRRPVGHGISTRGCGLHGESRIPPCLPIRRPDPRLGSEARGVGGPPRWARTWWASPGADVEQLVVDAANRAGPPGAGDPRLVSIHAYAHPYASASKICDSLRDGAGVTDAESAGYLASAGTVIGAFYDSLTFATTAIEGARSEVRLGALPRLLATQAILAVQRLDGWLLAQTGSQNPVAADLVGPSGTTSLQWFYFIPAQGEPHCDGARVAVQGQRFGGVDREGRAGCEEGTEQTLARHDLARVELGQRTRQRVVDGPTECRARHQEESELESEAA